jgi:SAM-dependent methyltransferase
VVGHDPRYDRYPPAFFARMDEGDDGGFYDQPRLVTHIDEGAIGAVGRFYRRLGLGGGRVLDLMSSWVSHFEERPGFLVAAGRNGPELAANPQAAGGVVVDLNRHQGLPFAEAVFDAATCCVSVDYLTNPLEVFDEVARVLRPGATFCVTFSNRCFPTKVIQGWAQTDDRTHVAIVADYFRATGPWEDLRYGADGPPERPGDPLYAVWARRPG